MPAPVPQGVHGWVLVVHTGQLPVHGHAATQRARPAHGPVTALGPELRQLQMWTPGAPLMPSSFPAPPALTRLQVRAPIAVTAHVHHVQVLHL